MKDTGRIHVYTGDGKGKTTAALGLAFRAMGSGYRSLIVQFMKGRPSGERISGEKTGGLIIIENFGSASFYKPGSSDLIEHRGHAKKAYDRIRKGFEEGYDLVIADEIFGAFNNGLISYDEIMALTEIKPENTELIMTGREAPSDIFEHCDLVTEMKEIKHYYAEGTAARIGIEC